MFKRLILAFSILLFFVSTAFAALNINTATQEEFQALTGIGPVTAEAIIEHREQNGPFTSIEELVQVRGIGAKTLEILRDSVTVD